MKHRSILSTCVLLLVLTLAAAATAKGVAGESWVRAMNTQERSVLLGDDIYYLGAQSRILGLNEERLTLTDLIWVKDVESYADAPARGTLYVEYDATQVGDRWILNWMRLSTDVEGLDITQMQKLKIRSR